MSVLGQLLQLIVVVLLQGVLPAAPTVPWQPHWCSIDLEFGRRRLVAHLVSVAGVDN